MFPFPIAKPQNCDIQTFYGSGDSLTSSEGVQRAWNKPVGVSHVYIMLIGGGGNGDGTNGGGSGAVTIWYGAAQHVPNYLMLEVAAGPGQNTRIRFLNGSAQQSILVANSATNATGGLATTANFFAASGFYKSTAGQDGTAGSVAASSTTFLSGGGSTGNNVVANYGYRVTDAAAVTGKPGIFMLQPIIVGAGGIGTFAGGIGCGGGNASGKGGPGMILIASW